MLLVAVWLLGAESSFSFPPQSVTSPLHTSHPNTPYVFVSSPLITYTMPCLPPGPTQTILFDLFSTECKVSESTSPIYSLKQ